MEHNDLTLNAALAALIIFIAKEVYHWVKDSEKKHDDHLQQNTLAIHRLTVKLEYIEKRLEMLPAMERDLGYVKGKLNELPKPPVNG